MTHSGTFPLSRAALLALALLLQGWSTTAAAADASADILGQLRALPGMTVQERPSRVPGMRFFQLRLEQPVDHQNPQGPRFQQLMTLLHRGTSAPVLMNTGGYAINPNPTSRLIELTSLIQGNQLYVEHRFFGESIPSPATYEHLTLQQASADLHRVVQTLKAVYPGKWVSSGASKGGMTSIYHRYLYPDDVDATVPYVAPSSHGPSDARYTVFLERVGDASCRERLKAVQKAALSRREELLPFMAWVAERDFTSFHKLGEDRAFEFAVLEFPYYFWQGRGLSWCGWIPSPDAPAWELFGFIDSVSTITYNFDDWSLDYYGAYYYQAATQLGAPRYDESHLHGLLHYPGEDVPSIYSPVSVPGPFEHPLMLAVEHWVRNKAQRMLFIYGENDPWATGAFEVRERNDAYRLYVPGGTHSASILKLPEAERQLALERLSAWLGTPVGAASLAAEDVVLPSDLEREQVRR